MIPKRDRQRFWAKVDKLSSPCWIWRGGLNDHGYGRFRAKRGGAYINSRAHRIAYWLIRGKLPRGKVLDHLCRNRACVNPDHLELVSQTVNARRGNYYRWHKEES